VPAPRPTAATVLPPAGRLLWRSPGEIQLEIGARRVVIEGLDTDTVRHLLGAAASEPVPTPAALLQHELVEAGLLWPGRGTGDEPVGEGSGGGQLGEGSGGGQLGEASGGGQLGDPRLAPPRPRLRAELAALSARAGERAAELLNARRHSAVVVRGDGRAGTHMAAILAAAGVGRVYVADATPARLHHAVPGGLLPDDEGTAVADAAVAAMQRHAPEVDCVPPPFGEQPDLVVLAQDEPIDAERRDGLHARGCAHLLVRLCADHGAVGPLVLPGLTSCLRCADLHRLDRDPAWNALAVQLSVPHRSAAISEVALATIVAGMAAMQALDFLDGGHPATVEGTLEMHPPDWRIRRRSWPIHPDCDCMGPPVR
jgi:hypothetical protein